MPQKTTIFEVILLWVEIKRGNRPAQVVKLKNGVNSVGRDETCAVPLQDRFVSRFHFNLVLQPDNSVVLEDLGGANGTFVNESRTQGAVFIKDGDRIRIGETTLRLLSEHRTPSGDAPQHHTLMDHNRNIEYRMKIGRDASNDLVIAHPLVSRFHAEIVHIKGQYVIYDLASANGVHVNGKRISGKRTVKFGDRIQIGGSTFRFQGQPVYESNDYTVDLQVKHLERVVTKADGTTEKLLDDIQFQIAPREFVAILGESGAGKSTLLGALTGMNPASSGQVLLNGRPFYEEYDYFRSHIGYVPQDDIVHKELTVYEVLEYSARLRLPSDFSEQELVQRVNEVIDELDLTARKHQYVKQLSGGQRKRVSIGVELLTKPSLFFLDEPTSGLDPGLEKLMMENLRKLADAGKTILMVTHATFNIDLCDKVIILGKGGRLAFFGTPAEALAFFDVQNFADIYKNMTLTADPTSWPERYKRSNYKAKYALGVSKGGQSGASVKSNDDVDFSNRRRSGWDQWLLLTSRYAKIMIRDRKNMAILLLQAVVIALLMVAVFHSDEGLFEQKNAPLMSEVLQSGGDLSTFKGWSRMSLAIALMIFTAIWLGTSNAAREITKELPIYMRERRVYLKIWPYLLSKLSVLTIISIVQLLLFIGILTIALGIPHFFANLFAFLLLTLCSIMMGLLVSAFVSNSDKAISLVPLLLVPQIVLSGAIVPIHDVSEVMQWIFYLAISSWGYELIGAEIIDINQLASHDSPGLQGPAFENWFVLCGFFLVSLILTVWALMRKDRKS